MRILINTIIGLLTLTYPFAVYFGIKYLEPWKIAAILIVLLSLRLLLSRSAKHWSAPLLLVGIGFSGLAMWSNQALTLRFYPVLMNLTALLIFAWSLWSPPSLIERIARMQHPELPEEGIIYTRNVTKVWCAFFVVNGSIALYTAVWSSFEWWSLYNGLISYLVMGILFAAEYLLRIRTQKHVR